MYRLIAASRGEVGSSSAAVDLSAHVEKHVPHETGQARIMNS